MAHFGADKNYSLLKDHYYWPSIYNYAKSLSQCCETCQKTKCITSPPKAPLVPMFIPNAPMQFISIDIVYLPKEINGYQLVFALKASESKAIRCVLYNVVFRRSAILSQDIAFDNSVLDQHDEILPVEFKCVISSSMKDVFSHVVKTLEISKWKMQQHFKRNLCFIDYTEGQQAWLKGETL